MQYELTVALTSVSKPEIMRRRMCHILQASSHYASLELLWQIYGISLRIERCTGISVPVGLNLHLDDSHPYWRGTF